MTFSGCDRAALERGVLTATFLLLATAAWADRLPDAIGRQLPPGYVVLKVAQGQLTGGVRDDYVVALACPGDDPDAPTGGGTARRGRCCCSARGQMAPTPCLAAMTMSCCAMMRAANAILSIRSRGW